MKPNLFDFATSELSQDAFLAWLLSWADNKYAVVKSSVHNVGVDFLKSIYLKAGMPAPLIFASIEVYTQKAGIDLLCIVNNDTIVYFEDKVGTIQHSNQLTRYRAHIKTNWPSIEKVIPVYLQTGDQSDFTEVQNEEYIIFNRTHMLEILETSMGFSAGLESDIFHDYSYRLRTIENDVQSYIGLPIGKWTWNSWKGFYTRIQKELNNDDGHWGYVPNQSGGFLGFWWHFRSNIKCEECYLQLEENKLCFKIRVENSETNHSEIRDCFNHKLIDICDRYSLKLIKPNRFGKGNTMTVAVLVPEYRKTNIQGILDISETIAQLKMAEDLLDLCIVELS